MLTAPRRLAGGVREQDGRGATRMTTDTTAPLVSVVVIFLDAARFLEEAVASVLAQDHPNWELLLVDDGSRDGSSAIARRYAERHPGRVRHLEHAGHANRGKSVVAQPRHPRSAR